MTEDEISGLEERLTKMTRLILDQPDSARHGILVTLKDSRLSISDLCVVIASGQSPLYMMMQQIRELRSQLRLLAGGRDFRGRASLARARMWSILRTRAGSKRSRLILVMPLPIFEPFSGTIEFR
jgi:hypothetical protein